MIAGENAKPYIVSDVDAFLQHEDNVYRIGIDETLVKITCYHHYDEIKYTPKIVWSFKAKYDKEVFANIIKIMK